jgi:hypothetical protein
MEYPLQSERIESHIMFVIKNITYESPNGRLSILLTLEQLVQKLPEEILSSYAETAFFTLLLRTISEDN